MELYADFKVWLSQNGRTNSTIYRHVTVLKMIERAGVEWNVKDVDEYLFKLKSEGKRGSYLNIIVNSIVVYAQFKGIEELKKHKRFKKEPFIKATMSDEEIEKFLSLDPPNKGLKMKAHWDKYTLFYGICAFTGARMGEVAALEVCDVDWGRGVFIIKDSKTHYPRLIPIPANIEDGLKSYISTLNGDYLFPTMKSGKNSVNRGKNGAIMDDVDWHYNFKKRINMLGIERRNLTPYSLRHSLITRLLEEDVNLFKVQKLVGHRDIQTTANYTHLTTKDIKEAIKKHPLIRKATDPRNILLALIETFTSLFEKDKRFERHIEDHGDEVVIRVKIKK